MDDFGSLSGCIFARAAAAAEDHNNSNENRSSYDAPSDVGHRFTLERAAYVKQERSGIQTAKPQFNLKSIFQLIIERVCE